MFPGLWLSLPKGLTPRAWDGTGHFAVGRLYDRLIFPDTFGWLGGFFGGMPFPNFYPPMLHWLTAFCRRLLGVDFAVALNGLILLSLFSVPFALWRMVWRITGSRLLAAASVVTLTPLLLDHRFIAKFPLGLDLFSTLQVGIYSEPLGFAALLLWLSVYLRPMKSLRSVSFSALLLAVVLLSNVFAAFTAVFFAGHSHPGVQQRLHQAHHAHVVDLDARNPGALDGHGQSPAARSSGVPWRKNRGRPARSSAADSSGDLPRSTVNQVDHRCPGPPARRAAATRLRSRSPVDDSRPARTS